ncbi:MAG: alpha/beta hydrolase [Cytophagales bacterium]|nr:MAG: alpha/beta hydrolase [Cytophagales bacterium]
MRLEINTPVLDDRPVFITGNFCDWHPNLDHLQLQPNGPGQYSLEFPTDFSLPDVVEYKYTRGGWDQVELSGAGEGTPNRILTKDTQLQQDYVSHWRWFGQAFNPAQLPLEELLSDEFSSPELGTTRRVTAILPYDYHQNPDKRYPVLYLNDGQNLVGAGVGYGSWGIEQKMAVLAARGHHEVILVNIDHGREQRISEFTIEKSRMAKGRGRDYLKFVANTLKPVIDDNLRTLPGSEHTGLGGSSLGGLISIYGGLLRPDVFGRLLVFSPSLWISPKIYFDAIRFQTPAPMRIYVYGGEAESRYMVPNMQRFQDSLLRQCYNGQSIDIKLSVDPAGTHQEAHWGREFPAALEWLFY